MKYLEIRNSFEVKEFKKKNSVTQKMENNGINIFKIQKL